MRKGWQKLIAGILCASMGVTLLQSQDNLKTSKTALAAETSIITLDGKDVNVENLNGLTYKGFGLLTANSTSDLLLDYKAEHPEKYVEMMQYLFGGEHPMMTHVKIEMGNDRNNSTGAEACTMRAENEAANVRRNIGFQIAADAKKINPDVKVSILRWNAPTWIKTDEQIYDWYRETILAAYDTYGYMVDYVNPNVNEYWSNGSDITTIKKFAKWVKLEDAVSIPDKTKRMAYQKIKFVITDEAEILSEEAVTSLKTDKEFVDAVAAVGYHYPNTADNAKDLIDIADNMDKEVWSSENQATFSDSAFRPANNTEFKDENGNILANSSGIGGGGSCLEMGNYIIKSFLETRRTHIIYQPVIGGFYQGGQYSSKELIGARDPWSGYVRYDAGLLVLNHLSKFAKTGWENDTNSAGIWRAVPEASKSTVTGNRMADGTNNAESYLTLASPDKNDFTTFCVNNSPYEKTYSIKTQNMNISDGQELEQWETKSATCGSYDSNYMKYLGNIQADNNGAYTFTVAPFSVVTVSTIENKNNKELTEGLPEIDVERTVLDTDANGTGHVTDNEILYADSFDYSTKTVPVLSESGKLSTETENYIESRGGEDGAVARYTHIINGAFEAVKKSDGNYVLRQQLDRGYYGLGSAWNNSDAEVLIGDYRWTNYMASVDVLFENTKTDNSSASIAIRQTAGGAKITDSSGYTFTIDKEGSWKLNRKKKPVAEGKIENEKIFSTGFQKWNTLSLEGNGAEINAYVNGNLITSYTDETPVTCGRIALGSSYAFTEFDNLKITKIKNTAPYYTEFFDNMQQYELQDVLSPKLVFNDKWSHTCGQGMFVYDRSASYSTDPGASISYTFTGTGLEVLGAMSDRKQANSIKVTVDGNVIAEKAPLMNTEDFRTNYSLSGLAYGKHSVILEVVEGGWCIDSVGILGNVANSGEDVVVTTPREDNATITAPKLRTSTPFSPKEENVDTDSPLDHKIYTLKNLSYKITDSKKKLVSITRTTKKKTTSLTIPATIKINSSTYKVNAIAADAFKGMSKLTSVTIGNNIKSIEKKAFNNCHKLKKITIKSTTIKSVGANAISGIDKKAVIKCNKKCVKAYKKLFTKKTGFKKTMKIK